MASNYLVTRRTPNLSVFDGKKWLSWATVLRVTPTR